MRRSDWLPAVALAGSLFIYLFYRSAKTVINQLAIGLASYETYARVRSGVAAAIPLHPVLVYSLPEALWIFSLTVTSRRVSIRIGNTRFGLMAVPLLIVLGFELLQAVHWIAGRFDFMDLALPAIFWAAGLYWPYREREAPALSCNQTSRAIICTLNYGVVYFAHVLR